MGLCENIFPVHCPGGGCSPRSRHCHPALWGFPGIQPGDGEAIENLARYVVQASFSQERITYVPEESKVLYRSKDGKRENVFDALEWLAAMCSHVPNKGEQMVRYYGYYSNVRRRKRKKQNSDQLIPSVLESDESSKERRKNWARLIQKIYEVDPVTCPKCSGTMKVISVIEDQDVIKRILKHLGLWEVKPRLPPRMAKTQPLHTEPHIDYSDSQVALSDNGLYHIAFIQDGRYVFLAEERIALPSRFKRCSDLSC